MKKLLLFYCVFLLVSCNTNMLSNNPEGIYACKFEHEFAKTDDTLELKKLSEDNNYFQISKRAGVTRQMDGRVFPKEVMTQTWNLEYDDNKKTFTERKTGKILIWNADKQKLILGNREYVKIGM